MNPKSKEGEASGVPLIGTGFHGDPTTPREKCFQLVSESEARQTKTTLCHLCFFPSKLKLASGLANRERQQTLCSLQ